MLQDEKPVLDELEQGDQHTTKQAVAKNDLLHA
jgi:hypothetical protein